MNMYGMKGCDTHTHTHTHTFLLRAQVTDLVLLLSVNEHLTMCVCSYLLIRISSTAACVHTHMQTFRHTDPITFVDAIMHEVTDSDDLTFYLKHRGTNGPSAEKGLFI